MIYIFDVDGTLTYPQQPIKQDMIDALKELYKDNPVFVVSGNDRDLLYKNKQMTEDLEQHLNGIFGCQGSDVWINGELEFKNEITFDDKLFRDLKNLLNASPYPVKTGNHIEERPSLVNFSIVGRNATYEQRQDYMKYDETAEERKNIKTYLKERHPKYDFTIGGQISLDISPKDASKAQILKFLRGIQCEKSIMFFGDKIYDGGNDYPLAKALMKENKKNVVHHVVSPIETLEIIKTVI